MAASTTLAAIDAGSNAIRLVIARVDSACKLRLLESERYPLRLGSHVFIKHRLDRSVIDEAVKAFRHFRSLMDLHDVRKYRAVATSAARSAKNKRNLIGRIYEASGIRLEVIDGSEEAALVRRAVESSLAGKISPRLIADLGGGSLEVSLMKAGVVEESVELPVGTVRMMETFEIDGPISADQAKLMRNYVLSLLQRYLPRDVHARSAAGVLSGGNAEALAAIAPGEPLHGIPTLNLPALSRKLPVITSMDIASRMKAFRIRKDRAEVIGIAGIVLATLGRWWNTDQFQVPGVGVKEGILIELLESLRGTGKPRETDEQAQVLLSSARRYAARLGWEPKHAEKTRELALALFDQLQPLHKMGPDMRLVLELAALLHDIGHVIRHRIHYKHGEYLVRHGSIAGLGAARRNMIACIIRYHSEPEPDTDHKLFNSFARKQQLQIRSLVALLRIADALDWDQKQSVTAVTTKLRNHTVEFDLRWKRSTDVILWAAHRRAKLFESVFDRKTEFRAA